MAAMKVTKQVYEIVPVDSLTTHPANPRRGDVGAIGESIEANGFYGAVIVQKSTGYVLAGNHRLLAAVEAGADSLPVIQVDVDEATATRILLADNRTNDLATYDQDALAGLLKSLAEDGGLAGSGYNDDDVDALLRGLSVNEDDLWAQAAEALPEGEPDYVQMSFVLHRDQAESVRAALNRALDDGAHQPDGKSRTGDALAYIAASFLC